MPPDAKGRPSGQTGAPEDAGDGIRDIVTVRLQQLRDRGYFTRAELGEPLPHGLWMCAGEFGGDGKLRPHCAECAA
jgi:hypothetical protein